jgi:hypothetical protein
MGGSSSGSFSKADMDELRSKVKESEAQARDQEFEAASAQLIKDLLAEYNSRDAESINSDLELIKQALAENIEGTVDLRFGGSVAKHTYVDGLSDIDALVLLNKSELKGKSPEEVKEYFYSQLKKHLPDGTPIESRTLTVTVELGGMEIQLLPAIKHRSGYRIADAAGREWSFIHPRKFSALLTEINQSTGNRVVPTVKLAKSIISDFPEVRRLNGYHIETLAVEVFKKYDGPTKTKAMLIHFFNEASKLVLKPLKDVTGQSVYVDEYLGKKGGPKRRMVADSLNQISRRMEKAENAHVLQEWRAIFGLP